MDKKIRVGMDISQLAHQGGVATYTDNLSQKLSKIPFLDMVYLYSSLRKPYRGPLKNVKKFRLPPTLFEMFFNRWRNVPIEKFLGPIDIFHSSDWIQPKTLAKKITTYHDVIPIKYPQWSHPKIVAVHKRRLKIVEREIDAVIAVSNTTKKDLIEVSNIPEEKITVIYEGPTISDSNRLQGDTWEAERREFREKYKLPERFVLAIGGIGERRNLERIKEACKDYHLVVAGQTVPWLDAKEIELLFASAEALVYASLYEGFGLPILDAFSVGCPVITSNISSMPEVSGEAAVYVNPLDVEDIKEKIGEILENKNLREEMIKKGLEQVKKFSWEKAAEQTYLIYKKAFLND